LWEQASHRRTGSPAGRLSCGLEHAVGIRRLKTSGFYHCRSHTHLSTLCFRINTTQVSHRRLIALFRSCFTETMSKQLYIMNPKFRFQYTGRSRISPTRTEFNKRPALLDEARNEAAFHPASHLSQLAPWVPDHASPVTPCTRKWPVVPTRLPYNGDNYRARALS
jgi:hypothetical protein